MTEVLSPALIASNDIALTGILDLDSHEMMPTHLWGATFGPAGAAIGQIVDAGQVIGKRSTSSHRLARDDVHDTAEISSESVWTEKGCSAPGAIDLHRRLSVLDTMGVDRQLMFPGFGSIALQFVDHPDPARHQGNSMTLAELRELGRQGVAAHNDWVAAIPSRTGSDRIRGVSILTGDSPHEVIDHAEALLAAGTGGLWISAGRPPGGVSPADTALDPLWRLAHEADVPIVMHVGTEFSLFASDRWSANVPAFASAINSGVEEFAVEPYRGSLLGVSAENFLSCLVFGGVLERHPNLRVGAIELGAHWVGPLSERLDLWGAQFERRLSTVLSMPPSQYLIRNVRATPFHFEDVASYLDRYPHLVDIYSFSTDYPHIEGGQDVKRRFAEQLSRFGADTAAKFFKTNGEWLLPRAS